MSKHKYADILIAIANGDQVQYESDGVWLDSCHEFVIRHITSNYGYKLRVKPKTININGFEVPEPLREAPAKLSKYYVVILTDSREPAAYWWNGDVPDFRWLEAGLIHTTQEAAQIHLDALLSFTKGK